MHTIQNRRRSAAAIIARDTTHANRMHIVAAAFGLLVIAFLIPPFAWAGGDHDECSPPDCAIAVTKDHVSFNANGIYACNDNYLVSYVPWGAGENCARGFTKLYMEDGSYFCLRPPSPR